MTARSRAILLIVVQVAIVCSIAAKFMYERATLPRVWVRVEPYDPWRALRGRYLALTPLVDACRLDPKSSNRRWRGLVYTGPEGQDTQNWEVSVFASQGNLAVQDEAKALPRSDFSYVTLPAKVECRQARLGPPVDLYIPDTAKIDLPKAKTGDVWLEVTVPKKGPPRAIQMATSIQGVWKILNTR